MNMPSILVICLATYGLSTLLVYEDGPKEILKRLRTWVGVLHYEDGSQAGLTEIGKVFCCRVCMSFWAGILVTAISLVCLEILLPFAAVGFVVMIMEVSNGNV